MSTPQPPPAPQNPPQGSVEQHPGQHSPGQPTPEQYGSGQQNPVQHNPGQYGLGQQHPGYQPTDHPGPGPAFGHSSPGHQAAPGFAPPMPPHVVKTHPVPPQPAALPPVLPPIRPHRNWYWVTALFPLVGVVAATVAVMTGAAADFGAWMIAPVVSVLLTGVWPLAVYLMRDDSERRRRLLLPPPPTLMHIAPYPGAPTYPVWFQPRTSPPLDPRNLQPRRFWYAVAVLSLLLSSPISGIAFNVVGDWLGVLLGLLLFFITPPVLVIVVLVRRARHRTRITREHLLKEWEQAHRG